MNEELILNFENFIFFTAYRNYGFILLLFALIIFFQSIKIIPSDRFPLAMSMSFIFYYPLIYMGVVFSLGIPIQIHSPNNSTDLFITIFRYCFTVFIWFLGLYFGSLKFNKNKNKNKNYNSNWDTKGINIKGKLLTFVVAIPLLIEILINIIKSKGLQNSYLLGGGDYYTGASGLSEYIAISLGLTLLVNKNKRKIMFLDIVAGIGAVINFMLGVKAAGAVLFLYLTIRLSNIYLIDILNRKKNNLIYRIYFIIYFLTITLSISFANLLRCVSKVGQLNSCLGVIFSISQSSELFNTNMSISRETPFLGFGLSDPISYAKSLIMLMLPSQISGIKASLNNALPYKRMIENGYHVGGGGSIDSHFINSFGIVIGIIFSSLVIFFISYAATSTLKIIKIGNLKINILFLVYALSLLSIRFFYYDPISVLIRTIPIGLLFYILLNNLFGIFPTKKSNYSL